MLKLSMSKRESFFLVEIRVSSLVKILIKLRTGVQNLQYYIKEASNYMNSSFHTGSSMFSTHKISQILRKTFVEMLTCGIQQSLTLILTCKPRKQK